MKNKCEGVHVLVKFQDLGNFTKTWTPCFEMVLLRFRSYNILVNFYYFLKLRNMIGTYKNQPELPQRRSHSHWTNSTHTLTQDSLGSEYQRLPFSFPRKRDNFLRFLNCKLYFQNNLTVWKVSLFGRFLVRIQIWENTDHKNSKHGYFLRSVFFVQMLFLTICDLPFFLRLFLDTCFFDKRKFRGKANSYIKVVF